MKIIIRRTFFLIFSIMLLFPYNAFSGKTKKEIEQGKEEESTIEVPLEIYRPSLQEPEDTQAKKTEEGKIKGRILDDSYNPVAGIPVLCMDEDGNVISKATTDENGNYEFTNLKEGNYTINVDFQGFSSPLQIKFGEKRNRPRIPVNLEVFEFGTEIIGNSFIRAVWDKMPDALSYRCEIYQEGKREPLVRYPDIIQNFCEFGNLEEDTDYQIRVYSKNRYDYSISYALGLIHTINKPPPSPFGLGIKYAKNYRVDLIFNGVSCKDLVGYVIQIKKEKGKYLFYSKEGLTSNKKNAYIIDKTDEDIVSFSIDNILGDGTPLIDNVTPYSFRVLSIDKKGTLSKPSASIENIVLNDTVPPFPPYNIKYEFLDENRVRISWETKDRDIEKYRLYYGCNKNRWDGVIDTNNTYYNMTVDKNFLTANKLYITITAIDRAGNESGYKPFEKKLTVLKALEVKEDIVLSHENLYKDYSLAIKKPSRTEKKRVAPPKKVVKETSKPKRYDYNGLKNRGFIVESGETALINGNVSIPENTLIIVKSKGSLLIENATITTVKGLWGGIRYLEDSRGYIRNTTISRAVIGIAILNNMNKISLVSVRINECEKDGVYIKNSIAELKALTVENSNTGIYTENSEVEIESSIIKNNERGILSRNYNLQVINSSFSSNSVYGLRLYGGGTVNNCSFNQNLVGIVLEEGNGNSYLFNSKIEYSKMDGIVINTSNTEIRGNLISGNSRNGIYVKDKSNPVVVSNDIIGNKKLAVFGGGIVKECFIAYNNGSSYIDDTKERGKPDGILSSSSSNVIKQILNVDYIGKLSHSSVLK